MSKKFYAARNKRTRSAVGSEILTKKLKGQTMIPVRVANTNQNYQIEIPETFTREVDGDGNPIPAVLPQVGGDIIRLNVYWAGMGTRNIRTNWEYQYDGFGDIHQVVKRMNEAFAYIGEFVYEDGALYLRSNFIDPNIEYVALSIQWD